MGRLFLLFTIVPVVELWLLLRIGEALGLWPTVALVIVTGAVGAALAKAEGMRVIRQWQGALAAGRIPEEGVASGVLVLVGGVLLVTPGVMTDVVGLLLLFPPSRRIVAGWVRKWAARKIDQGTVRVMHWGGGGFPRDPIDVTPKDREERRIPPRELE